MCIVLSDSETETGKKGLYRIVWRCSCCSKIEKNTKLHWVRSLHERVQIKRNPLK